MVMGDTSMNQKHLAVLGGDSRQIHAAIRLRELGYTIRTTGFELAEEKDKLCPCSLAENLDNALAVVLPLPVTRDKKALNAVFTDRSIPLQTLLEMIPPHTTVFCGMAPVFFTKMLEAKHCRVADYFEREDLTLQNALLTAEGIIGILTEQLPCSIFGLSCAITGYGRVAKFTARALRALGADVSIFARSNIAVTQAKTDYFHALSLDKLPENAASFSCIINTVEHRIIGEDTIASSSKGCVFIEVASAPYGIDFEAVEKNGRTLIKAVSLPGKTAPKTAGAMIAQTIDKMITEGFS